MLGFRLLGQVTVVLVQSHVGQKKSIPVSIVLIL